MNYQEQLNNIAKELHDIWRNTPEGADVFEAMATHSIKKMAEAYEAGRAKGYDLGIAWEQGKRITISPKFELIELDLIPDQEPPKESAFEKAIQEVEGAIVDRMHESAPYGPLIVVTLPDGFIVRFWLTGLSDEEYVKRAIHFRNNEQGGVE